MARIASPHGEPRPIGTTGCEPWFVLMNQAWRTFAVKSTFLAVLAATQVETPNLTYKKIVSLLVSLDSDCESSCYR